MEKVCSKCNISKPASEFVARTNSKDGLNYQCKACTAERSRAWYLRNKEKTKATTKAWIKANPEKWKGYSRKWFAKHPELRSKYQKVRVAKLKAAKLCITCGKPLMDNNSLYCSYHYMWYLARVRLRIPSSAEIVSVLITKLEQQDGKCYYTGIPIVLGVNASLDHIMPVSRFPDKRSDLDNVVWADRDVNYAKGKLTVPEFLQLCQNVITHNSLK